MKMKKVFAWTGVALGVLVVLAAGAAVAAFYRLDLNNEKPAFVSSAIDATYYDGIRDGLLTAGLGLAGLTNPKQPGYHDPMAPRLDDLRKNAIYHNYRGLHDFTEAGGFGRLFGPNIRADGRKSRRDTVAGWEYLAYASEPERGIVNVTMMVHVPDSFDPKEPCIVTAPSSGSRGVYGAIGTAGDWGLKNGCAVAYTDKGGGTGLHDLESDTVTTMRGKRQRARRAGEESHFTADLSRSERYRYLQEYPHRIAFKHAHSKRHAQSNWGRHVLQSVEFAFYVLNEKYGIKIPATGYTIKTLTPENTIVIAASISNGGGASISAAEQDSQGLIDGVAVGEPTIQIRDGGNFKIRQGEQVFDVHSKALIDYHSFMAIYQPCASTAPENRRAPFNLLPRMLGQSRCKALAQKGLLKSETPKEQAQEAQRLINAYGMLEEQNVLAPSHMAFDVYPNVAVNYAIAYGRFGVEDNLCGYSFAALGDGNAPGPIKKDVLQTSFATATGIPPTASVQILYNDGDNGPVKHLAAVSPSTGLPDMALDGMLCIRSLITGKDAVTGKPLTGDLAAKSRRVRKGLEEVYNSADLHGLPTVIVNGRADAVLAPNHNSRAYVAMNRQVEGRDSQVRYYEITNAQHLDVFNQFPGINTRYVPIHYYAVQATDVLYKHLKTGEPLPPSQVVHTTPRERGEQLELKHVPPIKPRPGAAAIRFQGNDLVIPE